MVIGSGATGAGPATSTAVPVTARAVGGAPAGLTIALDGSSAALGAVPAARSLAAGLHVAVDLLSIVDPEASSAVIAERCRHLDSARRRLGGQAGDARLRRAEDAALELRRLAARRNDGRRDGNGKHPPLGRSGAEPRSDAQPADPSVLMLAHHGQRRTCGVLSPVTAEVIGAAERPVIVVGPLAGPGHVGAAVLANVGDLETAPATAEVAGAWAARLGVPLVLAAVVDGPGEAMERADQQLAALAATSEQATQLSVDGVVVDDPDAAEGLCRLQRARPAQLMVTPRDGVGAAVGGSLERAGADRIINRAPVPVLVLPW